MMKLADVGQSADIVEVVYKYMEMQDGKAGDVGTSVEMTLASEESAAEVETKKAMLRACFTLLFSWFWCMPCACSGSLILYFGWGRTMRHNAAD